uniref:Uncharacterized protein n=1 Tax=Ditylenchus dipsaci TaxID=166011 RepID=A0A915CPY7_9BILA
MVDRRLTKSNEITDSLLEDCFARNTSGTQGLELCTDIPFLCCFSRGASNREYTVTGDHRRLTSKMSDISRIVSDRKPKVAVQLKMTDECCAAFRKAVDEKKNVRIIYEPSYCVIQIGYDNIDFLSFTCAASAVKDSSVDALKCVNGKYELLSSVNTKIQVNATEKTFAATREKSQKLKDEQDKKKAKDVVHTKSRSATSKTKPVLSASNPKQMALPKVTKPIAPLNRSRKSSRSKICFKESPLLRSRMRPSKSKCQWPKILRPRMLSKHLMFRWKRTSLRQPKKHGMFCWKCTGIYDEIKSEKEAREYREEYDYRSLYDYLSNVQKEFSVYDSQLKQIRNRQEYEKKNNMVQARFSELQLDMDYLKNRAKHATSRAKLEVLRKRIEDWNRSALSEF